LFEAGEKTFYEAINLGSKIDKTVEIFLILCLKLLQVQKTISYHLLKLDILIDSNEPGRIIQANHLAVVDLLDVGLERR